jgi:hypothetical protein
VLFETLVQSLILLGQHWTASKRFAWIKTSFLKKMTSSCDRISLTKRITRRDSQGQRIDQRPLESSSIQEIPCNETFEGDFVFEKLMLDRLSCFLVDISSLFSPVLLTMKYHL